MIKKPENYIGMSCIDSQNNLFLVPVLGEDKKIQIPWGEKETSEDLVNKLTKEADFIDLISHQFIPDSEEELNSLSQYWPWSMEVYVFGDYYIISSQDLRHSCPSSMPSCVAIVANKIGLMKFVLDYCMPFISHSGKISQ